jgi:glutathione synthase/RimK-type ligase-like ATP-grasp enzyme
MGKKVTTRLLIPRAGSPPSNTLIRSLKAGDPSLFIVGVHDDLFAIKKSLADRNYLFSEFSLDSFRRALGKVIETERIDLILPTSYPDVKMISDLRDDLECRVFLPPKAVIDLCRDKYELTRFLRRRGVPVAETYLVSRHSDIETLFRRFGDSRTLWCRIRNSAGSYGALAVTSPEQARNWIKQWEEMRSVPPGSFTLSEYLPGRDFSVQYLCRDGKVVRVKMHERLSYLVAGGGPSPVSSMAALAKIIFEPRVFKVSSKALRALDPKASGVFFVDLKENAAGVPCVTEINTGRFASVPLTHDLADDNNMSVACVRLALGRRIKPRKPRKPAEECYVQRDLDTLPSVLWAHELLEGIHDARGEAFSVS